MVRRRRIRLSTIKTGIQRANTNIATVGANTAPASFIILNPDVGARTTTGAEQTIKDSGDTAETVFVGDIVKYINLFVQAGPRATAGNEDTRKGWLEWALVMCKQSDTAVPITNLGTLTLGNVCTNMFRNECIFTGIMPIGHMQPNSQAIKLKVPKFKQKIRAGDEWRFITYTRDMIATPTGTDGFRVIKSYMYKSYS